MGVHCASLNALSTTASFPELTLTPRRLPLRRARCQRLGRCAALPTPRHGTMASATSDDSGTLEKGSKLDAAPDLTTGSPPTASLGDASPEGPLAPDAELVGYSGVVLRRPEEEEAAEASKVEEEERRRVQHLPRSDTMYDPLPYRQAWRFQVQAGCGAGE